MKTARRSNNQKTSRNCSAIYHLMNRLQPFTPEELRRLSLPVRISFESLKSGTGSHSDFADLADAINVSLVRAEEIAPPAVAMVLRARNAMMRTAERFERTEQWGFDGPAIGEVAEAVDFHEQLLQLSTPLQMHDALVEVKRRCDHIRNNQIKKKS